MVPESSINDGGQKSDSSFSRIQGRSERFLARAAIPAILVSVPVIPDSYQLQETPLASRISGRTEDA